MSDHRHLPDPDAVIAGAIGPPGRRIFYLQVHTGPDVLTLRLEKQQVLALATYLGELLEDLPAPGDTASLPTDLVEPVRAAWTVAGIGAGYREDLDRFVITLEETAADDDDPEQGAGATLQISRTQAAHLVRLAVELERGARPPCPLCAKPMDPDGHACVKSNGHGH
jgi:uncharacterized repeat protein (TIGR03847 family)